MSAARTALLIILMLLLALVLVAGQAMILAQESVLKTSFLLPHVERLFSTISAPPTHEEIIRYFVSEMLHDSRVRGITADLRARLMNASIKAFSPQWIQEELLAILNKVLAVLRGRSQDLKLTIFLSRRKDVLISELTRDMPPEDEREIRAGGSVVPDSVELTDLVGKEVPATLRLLGSRYILFSLLFVYVIPGVLVLLGLQLGRVRWGIVGIGAATLVSGIAGLIGFSRLLPEVSGQLMSSALVGLPSAFSWVTGFAREVAGAVLATGRTIALAFSAAGAGILATGVLIVILTRKRPV